jgi:hypothetical protein
MSTRTKQVIFLTKAKPVKVYDKRQLNEEDLAKKRVEETSTSAILVLGV